MKCSSDLIEAYMDGELDPASKAAVEEHLSTCHACLELTRDFANRAHASGRLPLITPRRLTCSNRSAKRCGRPLRMNGQRRSETRPRAGLRSPLPLSSPYQSRGISAGPKLKRVRGT